MAAEKERYTEENLDENSLTNRELISMTRCGNHSAFALLCERYSALIDSMAEGFSHKIPGYLFCKEDLKQEALMAFYRAAKSYDLDKTEVTFGLYAKTCIRNAMVSLQRKAISIQKKQRAAENKKEVKGGGDWLFDIVPQGEGDEAVGGEIFAMLTKLESDVLRCFISKMSYKEIGDRLGVSFKTVDNALYRVRQKIKKAGLK